MASALYVRQLKLGPMDNFVYLLGPPGGDEALVVDPAWDIAEVERTAQADGRRIVGAAVSHCHADHINGLAELLSRHDVPVYAARAEVEFSPELRKAGDTLRSLAPGEAIPVGALSLQALHTPGHTPGSQCFLAGESLVSGDTLFINACGRCDLRGGDPEAMYHSLTNVLGRLPGQTRLLPGHDYADVPVAALEDVRRTNPYFSCTDLASFVAYRMRPRR